MTQQLIVPPTQIRVATLADKTFVDDLAVKHSNAVGFIPEVALDWYLEAGCVKLAFENDEPCGYITSRGYLRWNIAIRPITQTAICFDAQRRHHGLALLARHEADGREAGQLSTQAACRVGLAANAFWEAAGYTKICLIDGDTARAKPRIVWRKLLTPYKPAWFHIAPPYSGFRGAKTKIFTGG